MNVLALICARGGSKGVPGKNVRALRGKALIEYTIECARKCAEVQQIAVSTDSDDIAAAAEACGVPVWFRRPQELATDTSPKILTIRHAVNCVEIEKGFHPHVVLDLDVGVPLRQPSDISGCLELIDKNDFDGVVTIYEAERNPYFNMVEIQEGCIQLVKKPLAGITRRQDAPLVYGVSPSVFAFRRDRLDRLVHLFDGKWGGYVVPRERAVDIDTELDFRFVEFLMSQSC